MKTYYAKYKGVRFEFDMPDNATKNEIKAEVNKILRSSERLIEAIGRSNETQADYLKNEVEFWKGQHDSYSEMYRKLHERYIESVEQHMKLVKKYDELINKCLYEKVDDNLEVSD